MAVALLEESDIEEIILTANEKFADKILLAIYNPTPEIMNVAQLAKYLGVSGTTVRDRIKNNNLPHSHQLGDLRFHKPKIDEWLNNSNIEKTVCPVCALQSQNS